MIIILIILFIITFFKNVGAELTGKLDKEEVMKWLAKFYQRREIKAAAIENGIDSV